MLVTGESISGECGSVIRLPALPLYNLSNQRPVSAFMESVDRGMRGIKTTAACFLPGCQESRLTDELIPCHRISSSITCLR